MTDLPDQLQHVYDDMVADRFTGSLTIHMTQGEPRAWDQRRSGRLEVA